MALRRGVKEILSSDSCSAEHQCNVLGSVRLRRCNTDFRTRVDVDTTVSFTRDGRADSVDNTHTEGPALKTVPQSKNAVGCLATLANEDTDVITEDWCLTIQEVRGKFDADRNFRQFLEDGTRRQSRVITCTASTEHDAAATAYNVEVRSKTTEHDFVIVKVDTSTHGIHDRLRLFVNLLLHEVIKLALHDRSNFNLQSFDAACRRGIGLALVAAEAVDMGVDHQRCVQCHRLRGKERA